MSTPPPQLGRSRSMRSLDDASIMETIHAIRAAEQAQSLLGLLDDPRTRVAQPGEGRLAEEGVIQGGRVIPTRRPADQQCPLPLPASYRSPPLPPHPNPIPNHVPVSSMLHQPGASSSSQPRITTPSPAPGNALSTPSAFRSTVAPAASTARRPEPYRNESRTVLRRRTPRPQSGVPSSVGLPRPASSATLDATLSCQPLPPRRSIAKHRLMKEAEQLQKAAPVGCTASPKEDSLYDWSAVIEGPTDTPYEGGTFFCDITAPVDYPFSPPKVTFLTRIYHCNISSNGRICVDTLNTGWNSTMSMTTVLESIVTLMHACNPESPLVETIAHQYLNNHDEFEKMARIWTTRYAT